jgi:hypothetical protein
MPAANSILSISLYVYSLVQSFILVCYMPTVVCQIVCLREISYLELSTYYYKQITIWYMPAYMPNIHYAKFYVFAYVNLYICYSTRISMPVDMLSSVYLLICQMLYPTCYVLYAGCHIPRLVCRFLYVECHVLVVASLHPNQLICLSQYQFLHAILYAGTWVPNICCKMPS